MIIFHFILSSSEALWKEMEAQVNASLKRRASPRFFINFIESYRKI